MKTRPPVVRDKLNEFGIDALCALIVDGTTLTNAAKKLDISIGSLIHWIESDNERSARSREARRQSARIWDEKATEGIENAADPFELAKAKELGYHYRWRASKIAPREYGDKVENIIKNEDGEKFKIDVTLTPDEAYLRMIGK